MSRCACAVVPFPLTHTIQENLQRWSIWNLLTLERVELRLPCKFALRSTQSEPLTCFYFVNGSNFMYVYMYTKLH